MTPRASVPTIEGDTEIARLPVRPAGLGVSAKLDYWHCTRWSGEMLAFWGAAAVVGIALRVDQMPGYRFVIAAAVLSLVAAAGTLIGRLVAVHVARRRFTRLLLSVAADAFDLPAQLVVTEFVHYGDRHDTVYLLAEGPEGRVKLMVTESERWLTLNVRSGVFHGWSRVEPVLAA